MSDPTMRTVGSRGTSKAVTPIAPAPTPVSVTNTPKAEPNKIVRICAGRSPSSPTRADEIVEDMLAEE